MKIEGKSYKGTHKIKEYAKLLRLYALPVFSIIPILGLLTVRDFSDISSTHVLVLLIIGALSTIYGHVFNEYMDVDVDKLSKKLSKKPLVSGTIPRGHALAISIFSLIGAVILSMVYFRNIYMSTLLMIALFLAGVYNLLHKKIPVTDVFLAGAVFFFVLFGASTVKGQFNITTYSIGLLLFLRELYTNSVESSIKDVKHETELGIKTIPIMLGVRIEDNKLFITKRFKLYAMGIEIAFMVTVFTTIYILKLNDPRWLGILLILALGLFYAKIRYLDMKIFERKRLIRNIGIHEAVVLVFLITILLITVGVAAAALTSISIFCSALCLLIVYGKSPPI